MDCEGRLSSCPLTRLRVNPLSLTFKPPDVASVSDGEPSTLRSLLGWDEVSRRGLPLIFVEEMGEPDGVPVIERFNVEEGLRSAPFP